MKKILIALAGIATLAACTPDTPPVPIRNETSTQYIDPEFGTPVASPNNVNSNEQTPNSN